MENKDIYIITSGSYSDYGIHSVWTDKAKAEGRCALLNAGQSYMYDDFRVEDYPLNHISEHETRGFVGTYDYEKHGYPVDVSNIIVQEAIILSPYELRSFISWENQVTAKAVTVEKLHKIVFDIVAEQAAKGSGLTD